MYEHANRVLASFSYFKCINLKTESSFCQSVTENYTTQYNNQSHYVISRRHIFFYLLTHFLTKWHDYKTKPNDNRKLFPVYNNICCIILKHHRPKIYDFESH